MVKSWREGGRREGKKRSVPTPFGPLARHLGFRNKSEKRNLPLKDIKSGGGNREKREAATLPKLSLRHPTGKSLTDGCSLESFLEVATL